jgi:hypothetical protein
LTTRKRTTAPLPPPATPTTKYCPRCDAETERVAEGRCGPCRAAYKRRCRAKRDTSEHVYADVVNDEGAVILAATPGGIPPGFAIRGISQFDGVTRRWIKTERDKEAAYQAMVEACESIGEKLPREPLIKPPALDTLSPELLAAYLLGDPHIGLYSWAPETGADFDLDIAERELVGAVDYLVADAPPAETAIVFNAGDFYHSDNQSNRTNRSGAALDVDGRFSKVLGVGIRILCRVIDRALEKHARVIVRNEIGNHDDHTSIMLAHCLSHHYRENPRVTIDVSPGPFWYFEWGATLFGTTHGHQCKLKDLPEIMAADQREAWGRTQFHHWYTGHVHHESVKDFRSATVETLRTYAAPDAWHNASGYRSQRDMRCDVWHRQFGRLDRRHAPIELVRELQR